jgi:hypothetical protein
MRARLPPAHCRSVRRALALCRHAKATAGMSAAPFEQRRIAQVVPSVHADDILLISVRRIARLARFDDESALP